MTDAICSKSTNRSRSAQIDIEKQKNKMKSSGINLKGTKQTPKHTSLT